jgi:hypothetical protein
VRVCEVGKVLAGHEEQVLKFGFFRSFPQFLRDGPTQKNLESWISPKFLGILKGRGHPIFFETWNFPQFSRDFEGMGSPQKNQNSNFSTVLLGF